MVNLGGIEHYRKFGYKACLKTNNLDLADGDWITVKYKYNRAIFHDGDFPHMSTSVSKLPDGMKRVILGFNCFTEAVGECCTRAPEHSDAFNRTVKLYQALAVATRTNHSEVNCSRLAANIDSLVTDVSQNCDLELDHAADTGGAQIASITDDVTDVASLSNSCPSSSSDPIKNRNATNRITAKDLLKNKALSKLIVIAAKKVKENGNVIYQSSVIGNTNPAVSFTTSVLLNPANTYVLQVYEADETFGDLLFGADDFMGNHTIMLTLA